MQNRIYAIDFMRFVAAITITWSHMDKPLGHYSVLATGGAFGDVLFFFISGYTLLLSKRYLDFFNWYKRRINRIYPTVFAWAIIATIWIGRDNNIIEIILHGGGFFVSCIMCFYLLFYPIKRFFSDKIGLVILVYFVIFGLAFFFIDNHNKDTMYTWQWSSYFLAMLLGAEIGKRGIIKLDESYHVLGRMIAGLLISMVGYYMLMYFESQYQWLSIFNIIPLLGVAFFSFHLCCASFVKRLMSIKTCKMIIMFIGSLCLEIYIVQPSIITDKWNHLIPFNIIIIFLEIILAAYILHCFSKVWSQTFKDTDYNLKEIIKPYTI